MNFQTQRSKGELRSKNCNRDTHVQDCARGGNVIRMLTFAFQYLRLGNNFTIRSYYILANDSLVVDHCQYTLSKLEACGTCCYRADFRFESPN